MQRVYRHKDDVVVEVGEFYHLLRIAVDIGAHKSGKDAYAVVDVDNVVANFDLI